MTEYERLSLLLQSNILAGMTYGVGGALHSPNPAVRDEAQKLYLQWMERAMSALGQVADALARDGASPDGP